MNYLLGEYEIDGFRPIKLYKYKEQAELARDKIVKTLQSCPSFPHTVVVLEVETATKSENEEYNQYKFKKGTEELFNKHSKLESFYWNQYTPYFNDGGPCYFRVHNEEPSINGNYYGYWYDDEDIKDNDSLVKEFDLLGQDVCKFLQSFSKNELLQMFEDDHD